MKKLLTVLIAVCLTFTLFAQNSKALDEKYGFREAKFETSFYLFKNLQEVEKSYYKSTTEDLKLGRYALDEIYYGFYKNQLSTIFIKTKGYINSKGILSILQQAYGQGSQDNQYIEEYMWFGDKVGMVYRQNSITDGATVMMFSIKLMNSKEADEKQEAASAVKDL